jgi:hypothetical protein
VNDPSFYQAFDPIHHYRERNWLIGAGDVGGKAKGLAFAAAVLDEKGLTDVHLPEATYVVTTEIFEEFLADNDLEGVIRTATDYYDIVEAFEKGRFRPAVRAVFRQILEVIRTPVAVRSSSVLEDDVTLSFAGKYATHFFGNTGTDEFRLRRLERAVKQVFASAFNPAAKEYRRKHGIKLSAEKMAVLVQPIVGRTRDGLFYPELAAAAFSKVFRRPSPRVRKEDGLVRVCFGLGTRTVDRAFARTFFLSNPHIRPEGNRPADIASHAQEEFDYVDLNHGFFLSGRIEYFLKQMTAQHKMAPAFVEWYDGEMLHWLHSDAPSHGHCRPVLSFADLPRRCSPFFKRVKALLNVLEEAMRLPVDIELTYETALDELTLVQLRPLSVYEDLGRREIPADIPPDKILLRGNRMVANGALEGAGALVVVDPYSYGQNADFYEVARAVGELNRQLEDERYILVGPGRWGSANPTLGVPVQYSELSNSGCLVEVGLPNGGMTPELSFGTHFFLDLDVDNILYLPVFVGEEGNVFNREWFRSHPYEEGEHPCVRIYRGRFDVLLDGEEEEGIVISRE